MRKRTKLLSLILAGITMLSFAACTKTETPPPQYNAETIESTEHLATGTLHDVKVTPSDRPFIVNGESEYSIVVIEETRAQRAAEFIRSQLYQATGVSLSVVSAADVKYSADAKYIVIGDEDKFEQAGLTMPSQELGQTGYYIKSAGDSVFLAVHGTLGYQQAAIAFLRQVVGYEIFAADTIVYGKDGTTLPDMTIVERPDFEFHRPGNVMNDATRYAMGFQVNSEIYIDVGTTWHNTMYYLPREQYEAEHPGWYSNRPNSNPEQMQICATARGDEEELKIMTETVADIVYEKLEQYPDRNTITFTIMDNVYGCTCEACTAEKQKYGTDAAAYIKLVNNVSQIVDKKYADAGREREYTLMIFAYNLTEIPPVKKVDGKWVPVAEEMMLADNVGVYIAPTSPDYSYSFYDEINAPAVDIIEGWSVLTDNIYMWLYQTNFAWYMMPHNTFEATIETYRYCQSINTVQLNNLGQYYGVDNPTGFTRFKDYIDSQAQFNVNVSYNDLADKWFANYFGDAAEPMRKYFDELVAYMYMLADEYPEDVTGKMSSNVHQAQFWPKRLLNSWLSLIDEAYAAIEKYAALDPEEYELLKKHIDAESLFPRYALLMFHSGSFGVNELRQYRIAFRDDIRNLNNLLVYEWNGFNGNKNYPFETLFQTWGVA